MPETKEARGKILEFKDQKNITYEQLGLMVNKTPVYVQEVLTGKKTGPRANDLILKIIQMFGIR
ncbi:XRE family transcriptional regulator [Bacillus infantis]|uniref:XRE family transcriptional regulator n=1 Tax=Bacillus infantis TaxID=324767 RepID=A0A5D4SSH9_9BACI|nr:XRE family transcriptional regulator [Bacillus infantis]TYS66337.1 XRE family transcriptional regulator [Bacillus infantis]